MKIKKAQFKDKTGALKEAKIILMGISMKQTHQSGVELHAFVNEINNHSNIEKVILVITDYLHRHYVQLEGNKSVKEAEEGAEEMGKTWKKKNQLILNEIPTKKLQIVKWKSLIEDCFFNDCLSKVLKVYDKEDNFKKLVDVYAQKFGQKYYDLLSDRGTTLESCTYAAKNYFLEESAIILKFILFKFDIMTYPGECNEGISYIYNKFIEKPLNFIPYRFRNSGKENKFFPESIKNQQEKTINETYQLKKNF